MITIYHNGECTKSKGALELLIERNIPHEVRYYLLEPLSEDEIRALLQKAGITAFQLVRKNEPLYLERYEGKMLDNEEWIKVLTENPILIERPIVENGEKAVVARPADKIFDVI